jgi:CRISPR system Cascade subunit CasE
MYLSQLLLDPTSRQVRSELANRYELHRTLCAQFENNEIKDVGLLYRIEQPDLYEIKPITVLVQTQITPIWDKLYEKGVLIEKAGFKTFNPEFEKGNAFFFRLLANPTIRRREGAYSGKRVELRLMEEQIAWLQRKGQTGGFDVCGADVRDLGKITSLKHKDGKKQTITHQGVIFEGVLEVTDGQMLLNSLQKGIGSAKAFGFGLLSLSKKQ